jgi:hypothetical protein
MLPAGILPTETPLASPSAYLVQPGWQIYSDPQAQFELRIPGDWQPGDAPGAFSGVDGFVRIGYLAEMGFVSSVIQVCERLANPPSSPGWKLRLYDLHGPPACGLIPYPETDSQVSQVIVHNPTSDPDLRFIYLQADAAHVEAIAESLVLSHAADHSKYRVPTAPLRPGDRIFWENPGQMPSELSLAEYPIIDADTASPGDDNFGRNIPKQVKARWFERTNVGRNQRYESANRALAPFGYTLEPKGGSPASSAGDLYKLYQEDELILDQVNGFWPVSVNASGQDFALLLSVTNAGYRLLRKHGLQVWDAGRSFYVAPIFITKTY